jgi:hypothetical protein
MGHLVSLTRISFFGLSIIFLLTSCGTPENKGEPSVPRDLSYEFRENGINLTWKSPEKNFNYIEEITNSDSQGRPLNSFRIAGGFADYGIAQIKDKEDYSYLIPTEDIVWIDESVEVIVFAKNNLSTYGGPKAEVLISFPKVTDPPKFKDSLIQRTTKSSPLGDKWIQHGGDSSIEFCGFLKTGWNNRVKFIQVDLSGATVESQTFTGDQYFEDGCVTVFSEQFKKGFIKFKIFVSNEAGKSELRGVFEVTNPYKYNEPSISPNNGSSETLPTPTKVDPWTRTWSSRQMEEVAKTVWCIEQGYRNYIYSKDICTNTLNR